MYFVSINARAQVVIILLACGPCVVIVNLLGQVCTLGRAPCTKETLSDFRKWCRVTRHPGGVFRGLTGCQRDPRFLSVTPVPLESNRYLIKFLLEKEMLGSEDHFCSFFWSLIGLKTNTDVILEKSVQHILY